MSQENVDFVRLASQAFASADFDPQALSGDEFVQFFEPEITFDLTRTNPDSQVYSGRDDVIEVLTEWTKTWDEYEIEFLEFFNAGPDRVVSVFRERGKLPGSDSWVEHVRGAVWTLRGGRLVRYEEHQDRAQALAAAGLADS